MFRVQVYCACTLTYKGDCMNKIYKISALALALVMLISIACVHFSAATIFESNGFKYSVVSATTADLHGRTADNADLVIPKEFNEHYVVNIVDSAFLGDTNIQTLSFSKATLLSRIGFYAFKDCTNLAGQVAFGGRIDTLGYSAFENCSSLESVMFRSYIATIPDQCFYQCTSLTNVDLNDRISTINKYAFAGCTSLEYVEIPRTVISIDDTAFYGDNSLTLGVWYDSYAHRYAIENDIPYVLLDSYLRGDANQDGRVDVRDVTKMQRYKAEMEQLNDAQFRSADVNIDCDVTMADVTLLQRHLAEFEDALW